MTQGLHVTGIEFVPVLGLPSKVTAALQSVTDNQLFPHSTCFADRETVWRSTSWPCSPSKGPHIPDGAEWKLTSSELKLRAVRFAPNRGKCQVCSRCWESRAHSDCNLKRELTKQVAVQRPWGQLPTQRNWSPCLWAGPSRASSPAWVALPGPSPVLLTIAAPGLSPPEPSLPSCWQAALTRCPLCVLGGGGGSCSASCC